MAKTIITLDLWKIFMFKRWIWA